jgi:hypothetical protein
MHKYYHNNFSANQEGLMDALLGINLPCPQMHILNNLWLLFYIHSRLLMENSSPHLHQLARCRRYISRSPCNSAASVSSQLPARTVEREHGAQSTRAGFFSFRFTSWLTKLLHWNRDPLLQTRSGNNSEKRTVIEKTIIKWTADEKMQNTWNDRRKVEERSAKPPSNNVDCIRKTVSSLVRI